MPNVRRRRILALIRMPTFRGESFQRLDPSMALQIPEMITMGAPDPAGIEIDLTGDRALVHYHVWGETNPRNRKARATRILRLIGDDGEGWRCRWCGDYIAVFKRTDARYCSTRCRKARARENRKARRIVIAPEPKPRGSCGAAPRCGW